MEVVKDRNDVEHLKEEIKTLKEINKDLILENGKIKRTLLKAKKFIENL